MKAVLAALSVGLALMVMATSASAVPFSYRFESTASSTSGLPAGAGDPVSITVTLDNGGADTVNQTWTAADLLSVVFDINNGAATLNFFSPFDGGLFTDSGSFSTDGAGNLTSVMQDWSDRFAATDFVASPASDPLFSWAINGFNAVLASDTVEVRLEAVGGTIDPANWALVTRETPLSLPSTLLLLLVGLGGVILLRRGGRGFATKLPFQSTTALLAVSR